MSDDNFLVNQWLGQLTDLLVPHILKAFKKLYLDAKRINRNVTLKVFQRILERIPDLPQSKLEDDYRVLIKNGKVDPKWLSKVIKVIFATSARIDLTNLGARKGIKIKERDLNIPDNITFLHKCYHESARLIWMSPQLFSDRYDSLTIQENYQKAGRKIKEAIFKTIRNLIPFDQLHYRYLDSTVVSSRGGGRERGSSNLEKLMEKERDILDPYTRTEVSTTTDKTHEDYDRREHLRRHPELDPVHEDYDWKRHQKLKESIISSKIDQEVAEPSVRDELEQSVRDVLVGKRDEESEFEKSVRKDLESVRGREESYRKEENRKEREDKQDREREDEERDRDQSYKERDERENSDREQERDDERERDRDDSDRERERDDDRESERESDRERDEEKKEQKSGREHKQDEERVYEERGREQERDESDQNEVRRKLELKDLDFGEFTDLGDHHSLSGLGDEEDRSKRSRSELGDEKSRSDDQEDESDQYDDEREEEVLPKRSELASRDEVSQKSDRKKKSQIGGKLLPKLRKELLEPREDDGSELYIETNYEFKRRGFHRIYPEFDDNRTCPASVSPRKITADQFLEEMYEAFNSDIEDQEASGDYPWSDDERRDRAIYSVSSSDNSDREIVISVSDDGEENRELNSNRILDFDDQDSNVGNKVLGHLRGLKVNRG